MIGYISGEVVYSNERHTIIKLANGLGYEVKTPATYPVGSHKDFFIYHSISENDQSLWGFETPVDRELFQMLLTVNKIGPSKAYPLIVVLGVQNLINGIIHQDANLLSKSPGIGKKMAEQIILSLKDKMTDFALEYGKVNLASSANTGGQKINTINSETVDEAMQALVSLGYKDKDILPLINKHYDPSIAKSEDLIKLVLKEL